MPMTTSNSLGLKRRNFLSAETWSLVQLAARFRESWEFIRFPASFKRQNIFMQAPSSILCLYTIIHMKLYGSHRADRHNALFRKDEINNVVSKFKAKEIGSTTNIVKLLMLSLLNSDLALNISAIKSNFNISQF